MSIMLLLLSLNTTMHVFTYLKNTHISITTVSTAREEITNNARNDWGLQG